MASRRPGRAPPAAETAGHDLVRLLASPGKLEAASLGQRRLIFFLFFFSAQGLSYSPCKFSDSFSSDVLCTILVTFLDSGRAGSRTPEVRERVVTLFDGGDTFVSRDEIATISE